VAFKTARRCVVCGSHIGLSFHPRYPEALRGHRSTLGTWLESCRHGCTTRTVSDPLKLNRKAPTMSDPLTVTDHTERYATPSLLVEGDTILAKGGKAWTITATADGELTMERDGKAHTVPLDRLPPQVTLVESAAERHERALALSQVRLGGEVVAHKDADGPYRVPASFPDPASFLAHLYVFHTPADRDPKVGVAWAAEQDMSALTTLHDALHTRTLDTPHQHDPSFYRKLAGATE
jgi:hypothetical protein